MANPTPHILVDTGKMKDMISILQSMLLSAGASPSAEIRDTKQRTLDSWIKSGKRKNDAKSEDLSESLLAKRSSEKKLAEVVHDNNSKEEFLARVTDICYGTTVKDAGTESTHSEVGTVTVSPNACTEGMGTRSESNIVAQRVGDCCSSISTNTPSRASESEICEEFVEWECDVEEKSDTSRLLAAKTVAENVHDSDRNLCLSHQNPASSNMISPVSQQAYYQECSPQCGTDFVPGGLNSSSCLIISSVSGGIMTSANSSQTITAQNIPSVFSQPGASGADHEKCTVVSAESQYRIPGPSMCKAGVHSAREEDSAPDPDYDSSEVSCCRKESDVCHEIIQNDNICDSGKGQVQKLRRSGGIASFVRGICKRTGNKADTASKNVEIKTTVKACSKNTRSSTVVSMSEDATTCFSGSSSKVRALTYTGTDGSQTFETDSDHHIISSNTSSHSPEGTSISLEAKALRHVTCHETVMSRDRIDQTSPVVSPDHEVTGNNDRAGAEGTSTLEGTELIYGTTRKATKAGNAFRAVQCESGSKSSARRQSKRKDSLGKKTKSVESETKNSGETTDTCGTPDTELESNGFVQRITDNKVCRHANYNTRGKRSLTERNKDSHNSTETATPISDSSSDTDARLTTERNLLQEENEPHVQITDEKPRKITRAVRQSKFCKTVEIHSNTSHVSPQNKKPKRKSKGQAAEAPSGKHMRESGEAVIITMQTCDNTPVTDSSYREEVHETENVQKSHIQPDDNSPYSGSGECRNESGSGTGYATSTCRSAQLHNEPGEAGVKTKAVIAEKPHTPAYLKQLARKTVAKSARHLVRRKSAIKAPVRKPGCAAPSDVDDDVVPSGHDQISLEEDEAVNRNTGSGVTEKVGIMIPQKAQELNLNFSMVEIPVGVPDEERAENEMLTDQVAQSNVCLPPQNKRDKKRSRQRNKNTTAKEKKNLLTNFHSISQITEDEIMESERGTPELREHCISAVKSVEITDVLETSGSGETANLDGEQMSIKKKSFKRKRSEYTKNPVNVAGKSPGEDVPPTQNTELSCISPASPGLQSELGHHETMHGKKAVAFEETTSDEEFVSRKTRSCKRKNGRKSTLIIDSSSSDSEDPLHDKNKLPSQQELLSHTLVEPNVKIANLQTDEKDDRETSSKAVTSAEERTKHNRDPKIKRHAKKTGGKAAESTMNSYRSTVRNDTSVTPDKSQMPCSATKDTSVKVHDEPNSVQEVNSEAEVPSSKKKKPAACLVSSKNKSSQRKASAENSRSKQNAISLTPLEKRKRIQPETGVEPPAGKPDEPGTVAGSVLQPTNKVTSTKTRKFRKISRKDTECTTDTSSASGLFTEDSKTETEALGLSKVEPGLLSITRECTVSHGKLLSRKRKVSNDLVGVSEGCPSKLQKKKYSSPCDTPPTDSSKESIPNSKKAAVGIQASDSAVTVKNSNSSPNERNASAVSSSDAEEITAISHYNLRIRRTSPSREHELKKHLNDGNRNACRDEADVSERQKTEAEKILHAFAESQIAVKDLLENRALQELSDRARTLGPKAKLLVVKQHISVHGAVVGPSVFLLNADLVPSGWSEIIEKV